MRFVRVTPFGGGRALEYFMTTSLKPAVAVSQSAHALAPLGAAPVLDLVHLSLQSLGDRALETELLRLFDRQCRQIMERLCGETGRGERRWLGDLAHTLKGSARAVGARRVAAAAQDYEDALSHSTDSDVEKRLQAFSASVTEARAVIRDLLQDA